MGKNPYDPQIGNNIHYKYMATPTVKGTHIQRPILSNLSIPPSLSEKSLRHQSGYGRSPHRPFFSLVLFAGECHIQSLPISSINSPIPGPTTHSLQTIRATTGEALIDPPSPCSCKEVPRSEPAGQQCSDPTTAQTIRHPLVRPASSLGPTQRPPHAPAQFRLKISIIIS